MIRLKGDTLIEVALAIGIFSMVAVAVVSVVSTSTSSAQSSLEATVTREGIDAQAEALRFIQSSYLAGGQSNLTKNNKYKILWDEITGRALNYYTSGTELYETAITYIPATCDSLYSKNDSDYSSLFRQNAFIINTKNLGLKIDDSMNATEIRNTVGEIVVEADKSSNLFKEAPTYPRIVYDDNEAWSNINDLTNITDASKLNKAISVTSVEGLYVVAVKDPCSTNVVGGTGSSSLADGCSGSEKAAYYDFYIRSCWYGPGADRPSSISTVIRLHDPAAVSY